MTPPGSNPLGSSGGERPYQAELEAERDGWYELVRLVHLLSPEECLQTGYYADAPWTVRDLVAHLGVWLAEAQVQFERLAAGTYEGHEVNVDALNATLLDGMAGQPWEVAWVQAQAARSRMIEAWFLLREPGEEAAWWLRKSAAQHFAEHLGRLGEWTDELIGSRATRT